MWPYVAESPTLNLPVLTTIDCSGASQHSVVVRDSALLRRTAYVGDSFVGEWEQTNDKRTRYAGSGACKYGMGVLSTALFALPSTACDRRCVAKAYLSILRAELI